MGCGTDLLYRNNHMAMLRRTHNKHWQTYMRKGMAKEIQSIRIAKSNGQMSLFDVFEDVNELIENRPCIFDRIDRLILEDDTWVDETREFDPDVG